MHLGSWLSQDAVKRLPVHTRSAEQNNLSTEAITYLDGLFTTSCSLQPQVLLRVLNEKIIDLRHLVEDLTQAK